jgi:hypothetical protein
MSTAQLLEHVWNSPIRNNHTVRAKPKAVEEIEASQKRVGAFNTLRACYVLQCYSNYEVSMLQPQHQISTRRGSPVRLRPGSDKPRYPAKVGKSPSPANISIKARGPRIVRDD